MIKPIYNYCCKKMVQDKLFMVNFIVFFVMISYISKRIILDMQ